MRKKAPRFRPRQDARHKHPRYGEEHRDAKNAEAFIEWPIASFRKPAMGMEKHNGQGRYPPKALHS
jgi:hypothetical protein